MLPESRVSDSVYYVYYEMHIHDVNSKKYVMQRRTFGTTIFQSLSHERGADRIWIEKSGSVYFSKNRFRDINGSAQLTPLEEFEFSLIKKYGEGTTPMMIYYELPEECVDSVRPRYICGTITDLSTLHSYYVANSKRIWIEDNSGVRWGRNRFIDDLSVFTEQDAKEFLMIKLAS